MKIHTAVGHYQASPEKVFNLISKEENLEKWATNFCKSVELRGDNYIINTTNGQELYFKITSNQQSGAIDMAAGPSKEQLWCSPCRVVSDNMGGSVFIFTLFQSPGQSIQEFDSGCQGLDEELEVIRGIVE